MTQLYIEKHELDLTAGFSNQLTYAIDDLHNIDSKSTAFSKTIILPGTANNNYILGNIFDISNSNFTNDALPNVLYNYNAAKSVPAYLEMNGLQIIKGVLQLLNIIIDGQHIEYEVFIRGELGGFVTALGNKRIQDFDFSTYDHVYSIDNIVPSWNAIGSGTGYYYPLIDYGNVSDTNKNNYQYRAFRPAFYLYEYINKLITEAGYTWTSAFFEAAFFKRLIIPNNQKNLSGYANTGFNGTPEVKNYNGTGTVFPYLGLSISPVFQLGGFTPSLNNYYVPDNVLYTYGAFAPIIGTLTVRINGLWKTSQSAQLELYKNNILEDTYYIGTGSTYHYFSAFLTIENATFNPGDSFFIAIAGIPTTLTGVELNILSGGSVILSNDNSVLVPINIGEDIKVNDTIPRGIYQKNFFTSVLKLFNLFVVEDKEKDKNLIITPYADFYNTDPTTYIDWSNNIDRNKPIHIKPMSELNARFYQFKYKSDNDFYNENYRKRYNEGYGDRIYDNGYEFAKDTDTAEVIFAASVLLGYGGVDKIVPALYKKSNNNVAEDNIDTVIRLMQAKKIIGVTSWNILNGETILTTITNYPYAGHFDDPDAPNADLNFGATKELFFELATGNLANNLFNAYYSPYMAEITDKDSRLITCMVKLTDVDIFNLDFSKFIFIDGNLYRLIKIIDYTPESNDTVKCELLRVLYTTF